MVAGYRELLEMKIRLIGELMRCSVFIPNVSWVTISLPFCDGLMTDADRFHLDVR
jgi:hypothetical protein